MSKVIGTVITILFPFYIFSQEVYKDLSEALLHPTKVEHLELRKEKLDSLPKSILLLTNLKVLDVGKNNLDKLPDWMKQLNIQVFIADHNQFTTLPSILFTLPSLKEVHLASNPISQFQRPAKIIAPITLLDLWHSDVESIPAFLWEIPTLKTLDIRQTFIDEQEVPAIGAPSSVTIKATRGCDCEK